MLYGLYSHGSWLRNFNLNGWMGFHNKPEYCINHHWSLVMSYESLAMMNKFHSVNTSIFTAPFEWAKQIWTIPKFSRFYFLKAFLSKSLNSFIIDFYKTDLLKDQKIHWTKIHFITNYYQWCPPASPCICNCNW